MAVLTKTTIAHKVKELTESAHYLKDDQGDTTDIVLSLAIWEQFLMWLEDMEDRIIVQQWTPRLRAGPVASGALPWKDVANEWE